MQEQRSICEYCGNPAAPDDPIVESVISPPVDGYKMEVVWWHARCADRAAAEMVR